MFINNITFKMLYFVVDGMPLIVKFFLKPRLNITLLFTS